MQKAPPELLRQGIRKIKVIWTAFLVVSLASGCAIYVAENFATVEFSRGLKAQEAMLLYYVLVFLGVVEIFTALLLRRIWLKRLSSLGEFPQSAEAQSEFLKSLLNIYIPTVTVPAALSLSVTFYGVVLAFIGISSGNLWVFPILGTVGIWAVRPKSDDLEAFVPYVASF